MWEGCRGSNPQLLLGAGRGSLGGGWRYPPSLSTRDQIRDTHPSPPAEGRGLGQRQPYAVGEAQTHQRAGSGNLKRETTPAERRIKPIISREGWAASLGAAVITAGATTRAGVNSRTGRVAPHVARHEATPREVGWRGPSPRWGGSPTEGGKAHAGDELSETHAVLGVLKNQAAWSLENGFLGGRGRGGTDQNPKPRGKSDVSKKKNKK